MQTIELINTMKNKKCHCIHLFSIFKESSLSLTVYLRYHNVAVGAAEVEVGGGLM